MKLHQPAFTLLVLWLALGPCTARDFPAAANATAMQAMGFAQFVEDFLKDPVEYFDTAAKTFAGMFKEVCLYGQNCGLKCSHDSYIQGDDLDYACYLHDRCHAAAQAKQQFCDCDDELIRATAEIADRAEDSEMVRTAAAVRDGTKAFVKLYDGCYFMW